MAAREAGVGSEDWNPDNPQDDGNPLGTPEAEITWQVDTTDYLAQRRASLEAHRSQATDIEGMLSMPDEFFASFFGKEHYIEPGVDRTTHPTMYGTDRREIHRVIPRLCTRGTGVAHTLSPAFPQARFELCGGRTYVVPITGPGGVVGVLSVPTGVLESHTWSSSPVAGERPPVASRNCDRELPECPLRS